MADNPQSPRWTVTALIAAPFALIVAFIGAVVLVVGSATPDCGAGAGTAAGGAGLDVSTVPSRTVAGYGHAQLVNAAQIMRAGKALALSRRDQTIGVMTAMGESSLIAVKHGDSAGPDSRGLFQQRANGAWGSYADRMDPFRSATNFFKALMRVTGRDALEPTIAAHRVQGNADPYHYRPHWPAAQEVVAALAGVRSAAGTGTGSGAVDTTTTRRGGSKRYSIGPVKPQTQTLADLLGSRFQIATIYGYRPHDPYPDHPSGLAIDLMVGTDRSNGQTVADYARANADRLGIQYIIWYQHIWNISRAAEGWRPMADRGGTTANHQDHVHITLRANATVDAAATSTDTSCDPQTVTGAIAVGSHGWTAPAAGPVTDPYGWRIHPITHTRRFHYGTDLDGGGCNSPIRAANAGTVVSITHPAPYGNLIELDHGGGIHTRYGHMYNNGVLVHVGDQVTAGQQIAKIGSAGWSTGCHVHLEVAINTTNTVNPESFFASMGVKLG